MTQANDHLSPDDELAAEYVLGVQSAADRRSVERRIETDTAFADLVDAWVVRLAPLERGPERAPPRALKAKLQAALFGAAAPRQGGFFSAIGDSVAFWRLVAGAFILIAVVSTGFALRGPQNLETTPPSRLVAALQPSDAPAALIADIDAQTGALVLSGDLRALVDPADRAAELWVIGEDQTPRSLGLIAFSGESAVAPAGDLAALLTPGSALAVSLEPPGGSPTGLPTGPVIAVGVIQEI
ncbi:MAG: anti-sigma factor [Maricaulaceae bacterium]|jgi:anti-sigma-K factor RskA